MTSKVLKLLVSRGFAVGLLLCCAAILAIGVILPSPDRVSRADRPYLYEFVRIFGIEGITASPYFLALPAVTFLIIVLCIIDRLRTRKDKDAGFYGSIVFHVGLLTLIAAGLVSFFTLFTGELLLTEGYPASLGREGFLKVSRVPRAGRLYFPDGAVTLKHFKSTYKNGFPVDYESRLLLERHWGNDEVSVRVNGPLILDGFQYSLNNYGFTPGFTIEDEKGNMLFDAFVNLMVAEGGEDSFSIPGSASTVVVRFFPDFEMTKDGPKSKSKAPNNPVAAVMVKKMGGEERFRLLKHGEKALVSGYYITFTDFRYWNHFLVTRDPSMPILWAGLFLVVAGLSLRAFTMYRKGAK